MQCSALIKLCFREQRSLKTPPLWFLEKLVCFYVSLDFCNDLIQPHILYLFQGNQKFAGDDIQDISKL